MTEYRIEIWPPVDPADRGGQHVGTGPSGVKVTHLPTGVTATCDAARSQHINRTIAMDMVLSAVTHPMFERLAADQAWLDARDAEFDDRWNARMNP